MKKYLLLAVSALVLACLLALSISAATFVNPVANGADPFVFKDTDGTYYMYMTSGPNTGYRVYTSTNLVEWDAEGYCLRRGNVYTNTAEEYANFWAPEIIKEGDTYYMVYTAQEHLGIATSDSPLGPFENTANGFLTTCKSIDGHFFRDDDGKLYLFFVTTGAASFGSYSVSNGNNIWGCEFDLESASFIGTPKLLIEYDLSYMKDWVVEGPEILKRNGKYYLTYSASGYEDPGYSVWYQTASSPLGTYTKTITSAVLKSDDVNRTDTSNPHLYGTAHHCFTTSPDDSEMIIVYHAHRSGSDPNGTGSTVHERRICIDRAWFDTNGVLRAGTNKAGVPSATAQVLPAGATLNRTQYLEGPFAALANLPTVYVAQTDGSDTTGDGTRAKPFKNFEPALAALKNGGTIVLTQACGLGTYFDVPAVNGPLMIKGDFSAVPLSYKFISFNSDVYLDNLVLMPETANNVSIIECNFNNVVIGEGVSCISQPSRLTFPVLVGGNWWYTGSDSAEVYSNFKYTSTSQVTKSADNEIKVLGGTWSIVTEKSVKDTSQLHTSAPTSALTIGEDVNIRPAKMAAPTVSLASNGATVSFAEIKYANKYVIYKDGEVIGYTEGTSYTDTTWSMGDSAAYSVAGYVNGSCIGDASPRVTFSFTADINGDGALNVADVATLLSGILNGNLDYTLRDVLLVLKEIVK